MKQENLGKETDRKEKRLKGGEKRLWRKSIKCRKKEVKGTQTWNFSALGFGYFIKIFAGKLWQKRMV
jgi:hypothetical protein